MKELTTHLKAGEKTELNIKKQKEVEHVLRGTLMALNGHFVFEVNKVTGQVVKAQYKSDTAHLLSRITTSGIKVTERLIVKPNCVYIPALNAANAKKKFVKNQSQEAYYTKEPLLKF